jgi:hypothetical protein
MILHNTPLFDLFNFQATCWTLKNLVDRELGKRIALLPNALNDSLTDSLMLVHRATSIVRRLDHAAEICEKDTHGWLFREKFSGGVPRPLKD